jgi:pimeloyl-ACP methyl ester carboxylesterase
MDSSSIQTPSQGNFAAVNGIEMYYEVHGQGTPLVLLHGTPSTGQSWQEFIPSFAEHYQVIVPDLRGYGRSTNPQNDFTHRQLAVDVFTLLDQLRIDEFKVIGISSGAIALLHMATQQPNRLTAMVVIGGTPYVPEKARNVLREWLRDSDTWDLEQFRQEHVRGDEQIRAIIDAQRFTAENYDDVNFTQPYLASITAETLIVHGDRDEFFPVSLAVEMYSAIPKAYLWVVPNGGHVCIRDEHAAPFTQTSLAFLRGDWHTV